MSRVATMGASSCATIAVSGFKKTDEKLNEDYKIGVYSKEKDGHSVQDFYDKVLYPTAQNLGRSKEYPFNKLMELIDDGPLYSKFIIAVLNEQQQKGGYWPNILEEHGFALIDKTKNDIGSVNHIYTRNHNRREL